MARDPWGIAALAEILMENEPQVSSRNSSPSISVTDGWEGLSIGVVNSLWGTWGDGGKDKWSAPDVVSYLRQSVCVLL